MNRRHGKSTIGLVWNRETCKMRPIEIKNYKDVQEALFMEDHDSNARHITLTVAVCDMDGYRVTAYVDDEGLLKSKPLTAVVGYPQPLAGNIVFVGDVDEEGNDMDIPEEIGRNMINGLPYVVELDGALFYE